MSDNNEKQIVMYGTSWCPDCHRARYFFEMNEVEFVDIDIDNDADGAAFVRQINNGSRVVPTILFPDGTILVEPRNEALAQKLGVAQ